MKQSSTLWIFVGGIAAGTLLSTMLYRHVSVTQSHEAAATRTHESLNSTPKPTPRGDVFVDPAMLQNLGVRSATVEEREITGTIRTTGDVDYNQLSVTQVNARIGGWVQKLYVAYVGQEVRRGQRLLDIYSPELLLTQEDYLRSRQLAKEHSAPGQAEIDAKGLMAAAAERLKLLGVAQSDINRLERSGVASEYVPIQAPAGGVVTDAQVVEGSYVKPGASLYTIANLGSVWVYADIYERELPMASIGQKATVMTDALPGRLFHGRVTYIYPSVNPQTRTIRVRLEFANPRNELRPGMYVQVTLHSSSSQKVVAVPAEAVLNSGIRRIVIIDLGAGHFMPRQIRVGAESNGYYPVYEGLKPGERIVLSSQFLIDSESNLSETLNAMSLDGPASKPDSGTPRSGH